MHGKALYLCYLLNSKAVLLFCYLLPPFGNRVSPFGNQHKSKNPALGRALVLLRFGALCCTTLPARCHPLEMWWLRCAVGAPKGGASATAQTIARTTSCGLADRASGMVQLVRLVQRVPIGCSTMVVLRTRHGHHTRPGSLDVRGCLNWCRRWRWRWWWCRCRCWHAQISPFCKPFFGPRGHVADAHFWPLFVFFTCPSVF